MATGKKYYWLKLKKDFMEGEKIDFLMSQENGSDYVVLYLMLCTKCINTGGSMASVIGEVIIPYDAKKIQRDCRYFSIDTVLCALELYRKLGMVYEQEDGILAISDFSEMVGEETDWAIQKRNQRGNQIKDKGMDIVHSSVHNIKDKCADNVHTEYRDKSIEKEKEKDIDTEKEKETPLTVSKDTACQTEVRQVIDNWNDLRIYGIKPISKISSSSKRYKSLTARIREYGIEDILKAIDKIRVSDFLQGKNNNGWMITFDWFVLPNNFPKVLEGNYDNKKPDNNNQDDPLSGLGDSEWARKWREA